MRLCSQAEGLAEWHSNTKGLDLTKDPPQKINKETLTKIRKADRKWCERRKRHQPGTGPAVLRTQHRAQQRDAWTPLYEKPNAALHQPFKCRQRSLIPARSFLFFPTFKQGKRLWKVKLKKDSCLPYFLLLLFLFFFFFFLRGFFSYFFNYYYYAQTKLPGENLNDSLRTADESNGLLKDFIYIIEHRENRESGTDKLTY